MSARKIICPRCGKNLDNSRSIGGHKVKCGVTAKELFWTHIDKNGPNGCWQWTGHRDNNGYGKIGQIRAHRISWEIANGPVPQGMYVLHKCDRPSCSNPKHLFLGTQMDNMRDMDAKGRRAFGERIKRVVLNPDKVRHIRLWRVEGLTYDEIAKRIGCSQSAAYAVCIGRFWKHVQ